MTRPRYLITLTPTFDDSGGLGHDRLLRMALKSIGRRFGFRCLSAHEVLPMRIVFVLDYGAGCHAAVRDWHHPWPPALFELIDFGGCSAIIIDVRHRLHDGTTEVTLERQSDYPMDGAEAAAWRRAGFDVSDPEPDCPPWKEISDDVL